MKNRRKLSWQSVTTPSTSRNKKTYKAMKLNASIVSSRLLLLLL